MSRQKSPAGTSVISCVKYSTERGRQESKQEMGIRIAMIGAGSVGFTRRLMQDILTVPELSDTTFALSDLSEHNMDMVTQLCRRDIAANGLPATVTATTDRRAAIADADYVICMIRQGGMEAFETDLDIPLKYGVDQCVGDTLCAGGLMYAQRTIPALLDFCKDIREVAKPGSLFLNYANPMAMNTWACNKYGGVRTIGLCHGVQGALADLAGRRGLRKGCRDARARRFAAASRRRRCICRYQPSNLVYQSSLARH